jgi:DNA-binding CsgD family transcriptional regulator
MSREQLLLSLVGRVYDAALRPDAWPAFLEAFAEAIDGHSANLGYTVVSAPRLTFRSFVRADPAAARQYETHYAQRDPWLLHAFRSGFYRTGACGVSEEVMPKAEYVRTEFYADFGARHGLESSLSGVIRRDERSVAMFNVLRSRAAYEAEHVALMRAVLPHLQRAFQLHARLPGLEAERAATAEAFDQLALATILSNERGEVAFMNAAASELVAACDGLAVRQGVLMAASARDSAALSRLIGQAAETTRGEGLASGGALAIGRPSGRRPYVALVTPLRGENEYAPGGRTAAAAVFVTDPDQARPPHDVWLRALFGLTRAESRVAAQIAQGERFSDVTERLAISAATGRSHLRSIFAKTGTRTQAQLVRLLATALATVRRPTPLTGENGSHGTE